MCIEYDEKKLIIMSNEVVYPIIPCKSCSFCEGKGIIKHVIKERTSISLCYCVERQIPIDLPSSIGVVLNEGNFNEVNNS